MTRRVPPGSTGAPPAASTATPQGPLATRLAWIAIAAAGIALFAIALGPHRVGDYYTETDFYGGYAPGARLLQRGVFNASRYGVSGPGFDAALALLGFAVRDLFHAGEAISIASSIAALALWFTLLRARVGAAAAAWTTALLAANATFIRYGYSATTDALALVLQALALHLALADRSRPRWLLAGACLALAAMTRYTAVALLPALLLAPALSPPEPGRSRARGALLLAAGFALTVAPFVAASLRQGHVPGEMLFHDVAYDTFAGGRGRTLADYQSQTQPGLHSLAELAGRDGLAVAMRQLGNFGTHALGDARELLGWPAAAAAALGLALLVARRRARIAGPLALCGVALYLSLVPAPASARYSLALAPFYLALAGMALASASLALSPLRLRLAPLAGAALLAFALVANVRAQREALSLLPLETIDMASVLRWQPEGERRVMALKPHVAWLADAPFAPMPVTAGTLEGLASAASRANAHYLYFSWLEAFQRPALWYLMDPESPVPGLRPIANFVMPGAVLYRIEPGFGAGPAWLEDDSLRAASARRFLARMPGPSLGRAQLSLAIWARGLKRFPEARRYALASIALEPGQSYAWRMLGDAQLAGGDRAGAIASFERAVELSPLAVDARVALGWMQLSAGNGAAAADAWRPVVEETTDRATLLRMADLFTERGEPKRVAGARRAIERLGH